MSWDRKDGTRGLVALSSLGIIENCPAPAKADWPGHWGGPWDVSFTGGTPGVSCNFCHKTWWQRGNAYVAVSTPQDNDKQDLSA